VPAVVCRWGLCPRCPGAGTCLLGVNIWRITTSPATSSLGIYQITAAVRPFALAKVAHSQVYFLSTLEWGNVGGGNIAGEMVIRQGKHIIVNGILR